MFNSTYVHDLSPFLIEFSPGIGLRWYGLSYLAGFAGLYFIARYFASRVHENFTAERAGDFVFAVAVGTIIGGRLGYCLLYDPSLFLRFSRQFPFWGLLEIHKGGMASHGGIAGAIAACYLFARRNDLPWRSILDVCATAAPLGACFGRLANFINGELVGRPCPPGLPWAVKFPQDILLWPAESREQLFSLSSVVPQLGIPAQDWRSLVTENPAGSFVQNTLYRIIEKIQYGDATLKTALEPLLLARHPSQLYEACMEGLLLFCITLWLWKKHLAPGLISAWVFVLYPLFRIAGEQFRLPDAQIGFQLWGLTRGQWLSIAMLAAALFYMLVIRGAPTLTKTKRGSNQ